MDVTLWEELIADSAQAHKIPLSLEQISLLAKDCHRGSVAFEEYSSPHEPAGPTEEETLKKELARERNARPCPECKGEGTLTSWALDRPCRSSCFKCQGTGKVYT